eukprot:8860823-Prorocentrum_lima.AAC.1
MTIGSIDQAAMNVDSRAPVIEDVAVGPTVPTMSTSESEDATKASESDKKVEEEAGVAGSCATG